MPFDRDLTRRIVVTVLVLAGLYALRFVGLPGLDGTGWGRSASLVALGLAPWMSAAVLVEVVTLTDGDWRRIRVGGPEDRARVDRWVARVWLLVAIVQAFAVTVALEFITGLVPEPGTRFRALAMVSLIGGSALALLGVRLIARHGIGNGFALVLAFEAGRATFAGLQVEHVFSEEGHQALLPIALTLAVLVYATIRVLGSWTVGPRLPRSAAGLGPTLLAPSVLLLVAPLWAPAAGFSWEVAVLAGVLAVAYALIFHLPWNVAAATGATEEEAARALRAAVPVTVGFTVLVAAAPFLGPSPTVVYGAGVVLATAVVLDLREELLARRALGSVASVWPVHRAYALPPLIDALEAAGIPARVRGRNVRLLYHFLGPYFPIEILVPSPRADEAHRLLAAWRPPTRPVAPSPEGEATDRQPLPESWLHESPHTRR